MRRQAALFDSLDTAEAALQIAGGVLATLTPQPERMRGALNSFMLATDLSEYLVRKGVPFRQTHHVAGQAVQLAEERGCNVRGPRTGVYDVESRSRRSNLGFGDRI